MELHFKRLGDGPPLIILHGLYGSSGNWISIGKALSGHFEVFIPDLRNHGKSPSSYEFSYTLLKDDIHHFMESQQIKKAVILGHSMGGKAAMFFADEFPEMIQSLIIADISPRPYRTNQNQEQQYTDHRKIIESLLAINLSTLSSRVEADHILMRDIKSSAIRQFLLKNLHRSRGGSFNWKINLVSLRDHLPRIMDGLDVEKYLNGNGITGFPVLFMRGEKSSYIMADDIPLIKTIFPMAEISTIPGAGHWLHAERPDLVVKTILYFVLGK